MSIEIKQAIRDTIRSFQSDTLTENGLNLFKSLGYNTDRQAPLGRKNWSEFRDSFLESNTTFNEEKAQVASWHYIDLLFQLSKEEMSLQNDMFNTGKVDNTIIESYLFFVLELKTGSYTRTVLSRITREINKVFSMPVFVLFKVDNHLTLSIINRRLNETDQSKDVLLKVTLIKDIDIINPHRAHIEILFDLSLPELQRKFAVKNFVELHGACRKTLDTKELNKKFYRELSDWYFWALDKVSFPADVIKDEKIRNATNLIRLVTRVIFIWFIKEKKLVPDVLFEQEKIGTIIKDFLKNEKSKNYYLAILQNLFFGTLNQKMNERKFAKDSSIEINKKEYGVKTLFRYQDLFTVSEKEALKLFATIPFLNGGLFDCLDKEDATGKVVYGDGFSRNPRKQAQIPDDLFFGETRTVDLADIYGDSHRKNEKVRGLFHILNAYKFTITENTPVEEEIALDPELLGRVFENLLASYNPETKTTARKQTGSFYTPREIVEYMVDESLINYLLINLKSGISNSSPPEKKGWPKAGVVSINNLPHLKTFRKQLRNNSTPAEAKLWTCLQKSQLDGRKFRRQHSVANYILDFYCPSEAIAIELDGEVHNSVEQKEYDRERDLFLEATGIRVLRFENRVVFEQPEYLLNEVRKWFGWKGKRQETTPSANGGRPSLSGGELNEKRLRVLMSYAEDDGGFGDREKECLIEAIDNCKIIDPACGSGAFPMGVLHKMVHVLEKLDPKNEKWKNLQIQKINIDIPELREKFTEDIEEAFEKNELGYARKLFLIENCIYGVDIQPIAVQIAKLRFFISLIVDQRKQEGKENLGVRSLPNLETKFVAADSLIALQIFDPEKGQSAFRTETIVNLEEELKTLRHNYFSAKTRKEKQKYQEKDNEIRKKIADELQSLRFSPDDVAKLIAFDPYDQNISAPFFDREWMFGLKQGFDIVIGNPPYVQIQNFSGQQVQKDWEAQGYKTFAKTGDVYCLFYERGFGLLREGGTLTYITSNKWMRANYGKVMRRFMLENGSLLQLIDFGDSQIFENATTYTNIILWYKKKSKEKPKVWDVNRVFKKDLTLNAMLDIDDSDEGLFKEDSFVIVKSDLAKIKKKIEKVGTPLKNWDVTINYGIKTGLNEAFIIDGKKKEELIKVDPKCADIIKPLLRGRDIKRYNAELANLWLLFIPWHFPLNNDQTIVGCSEKAENAFNDQYPAIYGHMQKFKDKLKSRNRAECGIRYEWYALQRCAASYYDDFNKDKLIWLEMSPKSNFTLDLKRTILLNTAYIMTGKEIKFIISVINSILIDKYFSFIATDVRGGTRRYTKQYVELLPIPKIPASQQLPFEILVDCILFAKEINMDLESDLFESVIDGMVFDLYFPEEMKAAHCYITDRVAEVIKPFKPDDTDQFKKEYIKELYKFFNKDKIIYHGLIHRRTVKLVEIITGANNER